MTKSLPSLTIVRRIKATPAKIYAAITQPKLMMQWWGPDAGPTLSAEADVRPGGRFSVVFRLLNGDEHNPTGVYQEVVPEKKLVFTWEWPGMPERESLVTFLLEPFDGGTELTLIHEHLPDEEARKSHEKGWNGLLDKLIPADRRGRSDAMEWLFAALASVEAASQPWSFFMFSGDTDETPMRKFFDSFLEARLKHMETVLDGSEWLVGTFSVSWRTCCALSIGSTG
jgi:uncharacterized protein YndB with AHSA1/START domain